jgi:predicted nuclease of predicted toxin-antitoxin system
VKLLFDENLSTGLPHRLADVYPDSAHLRDVGLNGADDADVWNYAAREGFAVVTKDDDFRERSVLKGSPPKLVMIRTGNCSTRDVEALLRANAVRLEAFNRDLTASLMELP